MAWRILLDTPIGTSYIGEPVTATHVSYAGQDNDADEDDDAIGSSDVRLSLSRKVGDTWHHGPQPEHVSLTGATYTGMWTEMAAAGHPRKQILTSISDDFGRYAGTVENV